MKKINSLLIFLFASLSMWAQDYPVVSIRDIQFVSPENLAACIDTSAFGRPGGGDTIIVHAKIVVPGGLAQVRDGRSTFLQDTAGVPWNGLDMFHDIGITPLPTGDDILELTTGDSVHVTGIVLDFGGHETEILPLDVQLIDVDRPVTATKLTPSDFNTFQDGAARVNDLTTGEQWEGTYVEFNNVTVTAVSFFSGDTRVSFDVSDENGGTVNVSDRFLVQRLPVNGGTFEPPLVGTVFTSIKGLMIHSPNGCTGDGGRGYEMYPFRAEDYVTDPSTIGPLINDITRDKVTPTSSESVTVTATIIDPDTTKEIISASLFYAVGVDNSTYVEAPMFNEEDVWSAEIPAGAYEDGDFIKYYISASNNTDQTNSNPNVPNEAEPLFFTARDNGLSIYDIQFTPFASGNSGYRGEDVTIEGVVISENLGETFIQEEGQMTWGGISLRGNAALAELAIGDKVRVTGTVTESNDLTALTDVTTVETIGAGEIEPIELDPSIFANNDLLTESYESMLVKLVNPSGNSIYVVEVNADAPSNFAEYRVGTDLFDANTGSRVLAGRRTGSAPSSLAVSYINDSSWIANSGVLEVDPCIISYGDSMASLTGVMYYSFRASKLLPRSNPDFELYDGANCPLTPSSIADELAGSEFVAYPNPVEDQLNVRYSLTKAVNAEVEMMDMLGRVIVRRGLNGLAGETALNTSRIASGIYVMSIRAEGEVVYQQKIVLQR